MFAKTATIAGDDQTHDHATLRAQLHRCELHVALSPSRSCQLRISKRRVDGRPRSEHFRGGTVHRLAEV